MNRKRMISLLSVMFMLALAAGMSLALGPQPLVARSAADEATAQALVGSGFTYQGRLTDGDGNPISDTCGLDFTLWDAESGGTMIGHQIVTGVEVNDGYLAVLLNSGGEFGANAFRGEARWLKIAVKCSGDADWNALTGRQLLSAAPYALSLRPGTTISGTVTGRSVLTVINGAGGGGGLVGYSHDADGVHGQSVDGAGVSAFSFNQVAVYGESTYNTAGFFTSTHGYGLGAKTTSDDPEIAAVEGVNEGAGRGVVGFSTDDTGVYGNSVNGQGVVGLSGENTGVYGSSVNGHGVEGFSVNEVAVYGQSENTAGYFTSTLSVGVHGSTTSDDPLVAAVEGVNLGAGPGVVGLSSDNTGVYGSSTNGHGVEGYSVNEVAVYGQSEDTAGYFTSTNSIGVHGNTTSDNPEVAAVEGVNLGTGRGVAGYGNDGPGGYFANQAGGTVLYAAGDVAQDATAAGLVKAAAFVSCADSAPDIYRAFNTVAGFVSLSPTGAVGACRLDFGFDLSERFWTVMAYDDTSATTVSCILYSLDDSILLCKRWDSAGNPVNGDIMVLVY
jgi:hypothetical protein